MRTTTDASHMASRTCDERRIDDEPLGTSPSNATSFDVRPRELGVGNADAPRRVAVDIHAPVEVQIRTPLRQWQFDVLDEDDEIAYTGIGRSRILEDDPMCIPGWMPSVIAYAGFEVADSGVKR
jgi:hypothetical protein